MAILSDSRPRDGAEASSPLRITLRVAPPPELGCPVLARSVDGKSVTQDTICRDGCGDNCECRAEITVIRDDDERRQLVRSTVEKECTCPIFRNNDCVTSIESIQGGSFIITATVPDRTTLQKIVDELRAIGATVGLRKIRRLDSESADRMVELSVNAITDKQREAIQTAHTAGYYETPREADLEDLADRLGISRSAVSQRLNAAESTLVQELVRIEEGNE